jgi:hypothetical protein
VNLRFTIPKKSSLGDFVPAFSLSHDFPKVFFSPNQHEFTFHLTTGDPPSGALSPSRYKEPSMENLSAVIICATSFHPPSKCLQKPQAPSPIAQSANLGSGHLSSLLAI